MCGQLPDSTPGNGAWWEIICQQPLTGDEIKVITTKDTPLIMSIVEAYGQPVNELCAERVE